MPWSGRERTIVEERLDRMCRREHARRTLDACPQRDMVERVVVGEEKWLLAMEKFWRGEKFRSARSDQHSVSPCTYHSRTYTIVKAITIMSHLSTERI